VFRRKALEISEALQNEFGDLKVEINSKTPRRGSFELSAIDSTGKGKSADVFQLLFSQVLI